MSPLRPVLMAFHVNNHHVQGTLMLVYVHRLLYGLNFADIPKPLLDVLSHGFLLLSLHGPEPKYHKENLS